jgi:hypothetical protein
MASSKVTDPRPSDDQPKKRSKSREKETRTCHYCKKSGHLKKYCYSWKRDRGKMQNSQKKGDDRNTAAAVSKSDDEVTLICATSECHHVESSDTEWLVDTGASYHCVPRREYFMNYQAGSVPASILDATVSSILSRKTTL